MVGQAASRGRLDTVPEAPQLPVELAGYTFDTSLQRDPFAQKFDASASTKMARAQMESPPVLSLPLPGTREASPPPPALNYRYLGQMSGPDGVTYVYLARADSAVHVRVGTSLDEGYVVERIDADVVTLHHRASSASAFIAIPPGQQLN